MYIIEYRGFEYLCNGIYIERFNGYDLYGCHNLQNAGNIVKHGNSFGGCDINIKVRAKIDKNHEIEPDVIKAYDVCLATEKGVVKNEHERKASHGRIISSDG